MLLETIETDPSGSFIYMERFVNGGSPSGFSFSHTTSYNTSPLNANIPFHLIGCEARQSTAIKNYGTLLDGNLLIDNPKHSIMWAHPDMRKNTNLRIVAYEDIQLSSFVVQPSSSGRTVCILSPQLTGFLKLHYDGIIGRIGRQITHKHILASMETDKLIKKFLSDPLCPSSLGILSESGARLFITHDEKNESQVEWGMVFRDSKPIGKQVDQIRYLIPGFSLFSTDYISPQHPSLLEQLHKKITGNFELYVSEELLLPLISNYFKLVTNLGLHAEWHAQNIIFGFDDSWHCVATILRDFESIDRDLGIMKNLGITGDMLSYPYKCVEPTQENYRIRHSFMFDHKFSEYLIKPIIDHCEDRDLANRDNLLLRARSYTASELRKLPNNFWPKDNKWYKYDAGIAIKRTGHQRPYTIRDNPYLR